MRSLSIFCLAACVAIVAPASAEELVAEVADETALTLGIGARVGGYGFRDAGGAAVNWSNCRMNGVGLFGTFDLGEVFFGELSADFYHSIKNDWQMDRVSFFPTAAIGARAFSGALVSPYFQAGGGPEFTRVELGGKRSNHVLPAVFLGFGGELNLNRFHLGTNLKVFSMGLPEYELPAQSYSDNYVIPDLSPARETSMRQEVAAQMQFTARYTF